VPPQGSQPVHSRPRVPPFARVAFTGVVAIGPALGSTNSAAIPQSSHAGPRTQQSRAAEQVHRRHCTAFFTATAPAKKPAKAHLPSKAPSSALGAFRHRARLLVNLEADRALAAILASYRAPGVLAGAQRVSDRAQCLHACALAPAVVVSRSLVVCRAMRRATVYTGLLPRRC
jgi:hypothetical protein